MTRAVLARLCKIFWKSWAFLRCSSICRCRAATRASRHVAPNRKACRAQGPARKTELPGTSGLLGRCLKAFHKEKKKIRAPPAARQASAWAVGVDAVSSDRSATPHPPVRLKARRSHPAPRQGPSSAPSAVPGAPPEAHRLWPTTLESPKPSTPEPPTSPKPFPYLHL